MKAEEAKRLKHLEEENKRLKYLLAEAELDKAILKEALQGISRHSRIFHKYGLRRYPEHLILILVKWSFDSHP